MPASMSIASGFGQQEEQPKTAPQSVDNPLCDVCRHTVVDHDAIALRFCRAPASSTASRMPAFRRGVGRG
jgi:hypothetical protein